MNTDYKKKLEDYIIYAYPTHVEIHGHLSTKETIFYLQFFSERGFDQIETTENECLKLYGEVK